MSKISFEALKRDGLKLGALVTNVERGTKNFEKLSEAYSSCVLSTSNEKSLRDYFLNFFRLYLYIIDDITVLFTGSIHRKYHLSQHGELYGREGSAGGGASALHSRGKEGSYFTSGEFSRCSIDGFNYEFRKAETKMGKYEEALEPILGAVDLLSDKLQLLMKLAQASFERSVYKILKSNTVAATQIAISLSKHLGETFTFQISKVLRVNIGGLQKKIIPGRISENTVEASIGFSFSREEEISTPSYEKHRDLSIESIYIAECDKILKFGGHRNARVVTMRANLKRKIVLGSDEDDSDSDVEYNRVLKRHMPQPSELCMISDSNNLIERTANSLALKGNVVGAASAESILAIKRPFSVNVNSIVNNVVMINKNQYEQATAVPLSCTTMGTAGQKRNQGIAPLATSKLSPEAAIESLKYSALQLGSLVPITFEWKCRLHSLQSQENKCGGFDILVSMERYRGVVWRESRGVYAADGPGSCTNFPGIRFTAMDIMDYCSAAIWTKLMSAEVQTAFPIASLPDHILVDGNKLFRANDVLEVGASTDVAVVCNEVLSIDVFSKFLNCLRTLQENNERRLLQRVLIPPLQLLRSLNAAIECFVAESDILFDLRAVRFPLSVPDLHIDCSSLEFKRWERENSSKSLQYVFIVSSLNALRKLSAIHDVDLSGVPVIEDAVAAVLCSCRRLILRGCNVKWTMIARAVLRCAADAYSQSGSCEDEVWRLVDSEDKTLSIEYIDMSCNCNLLVNPEKQIVLEIWGHFCDFRISSSYAGRNSDVRLRQEEIIQACFEFLLALSPCLKTVDLSYCFSTLSTALSLCDYVMHSLSQRCRKSFPPIDILIIRGLDDFLSTEAIDAFYQRIMTEGTGSVIRLIL